MTDVRHSVCISLLLHAATLLLLVQSGVGHLLEKPITVDLALCDLPEASLERTGGAGGGKAVEARRPMPPASDNNPQNVSLSRHLEQSPGAIVTITPSGIARQPAAMQAPADQASRNQAPLNVKAGPVAPQATAAAQGSVNGATEAANRTAVPGGAGEPGASGSGRMLHPGKGPGEGSSLLKKRYLGEHFAYIMKIIQKNMNYPSRAKREGWTGKALVSFVILENGQVDNIRILTSTGHQLLDADASESIRAAAPFPPPPIKAELVVPINYQMSR